MADVAGHVEFECLSRSFEMDKLRDGWFSEECDMWPGQKFSLAVKEVIHHEKSKYQDILIFQRCIKIIIMPCFLPSYLAT